MCHTLYIILDPHGHCMFDLVAASAFLSSDVHAAPDRADVEEGKIIRRLIPMYKARAAADPALGTGDLRLVGQGC